MNSDVIYQIALSMVPNVGPVQAKILAGCFPSAREIFLAKEYQLKKIEGIGEVRARSIKAFNGFNKIETEITFLEKYQVQPLFLTDPLYPQRLLHCFDPPTVLYFKGKADLNASKIISVVGTRKNSAYGKLMTERLVERIAVLDNSEFLIVSGLAYGIDAIAHRSALTHHLPTVGVMANGIDLIYPQCHLSLAREMVRSGGGILTEFMSGSLPDRHHFPTRNRIVAGISDATIVIETDVRGGSMISAELANGYNRDVFAIPGKLTDDRSAGCNLLIKNNKAILLRDADDLLDCMNWTESSPVERKKQKSLFVELNPEEQIVMNIFNEKDQIHIDELRLKTGLSSSVVARCLLNLEMQQLIISRPGKLYAIQ